MTFVTKIRLEIFFLIHIIFLNPRVRVVGKERPHGAQSANSGQIYQISAGWVKMVPNPDLCD